MRVGSGGATLSVLKWLAENGGWEGKRGLVIHSGGDSKRVPQYSALGKLFSPVPHPQDKAIRTVHQIKNNLAETGKDLHFEIRPGTGFRWLGESEPVEVPTVAFEPAETFNPKSKHELAAMLIKKALANGPMESMEIKKLMAEYRIGDKTMNEVKAELGIKPYRKMRSWYWVLPGTDENKEVET